MTVIGTETERGEICSSRVIDELVKEESLSCGVWIKPSERGASCSCGVRFKG